MIVLHTIMIRYSLLLEKSKSWKLASDDIDIYKRNLFNEERLDERKQLFQQLTLPSLKNQNILNNAFKVDVAENNPSRVEYQVYLITSEDLPQQHKDEINALTEDIEWLNINYLPTKGVRLESVVTNYVEKLYQETKETILYSSVRLDDDDILSIRFFEYLSKYTTLENVGRVVTFANGYAGFYNFEMSAYIDIYDYFYPMLALGLAYINKFDQNGYANDTVKTVFRTGSHTLVNRKFPLITDGINPTYIRTLYEGSDSHDIKRATNIRNKQLRVHPVKVMQNMGISLPVIFDGKKLNMSTTDIQNTSVHSIRLNEKNVGNFADIQVCIFDKELLIEICRCTQTEYTFEFNILLEGHLLSDSIIVVHPRRQVIIDLPDNIGAKEGSPLILIVNLKDSKADFSKEIELY